MQAFTIADDFMGCICVITDEYYYVCFVFVFVTLYVYDVFKHRSDAKRLRLINVAVILNTEQISDHLDFQKIMSDANQRVKDYFDVFCVALTELRKYLFTV